VSQIEDADQSRISGPGAGGPPGGARPAPTEPHPLMAEVIPANQRASRGISRRRHAYFTASTRTRAAPTCRSRRNATRENGGVMPTTRMRRRARADGWAARRVDTGFSVIVTDIRERRFEVVDRTRGIAFGWDTSITTARGEDEAARSITRCRRGADFRRRSRSISRKLQDRGRNIRQIEGLCSRRWPYQMESDGEAHRHETNRRARAAQPRRRARGLGLAADTAPGQGPGWTGVTNP